MRNFTKSLCNYLRWNRHGKSSQHIWRNPLTTAGTCILWMANSRNWSDRARRY